MGSRSHNSPKTRYERNKRRASALLMQICQCGKIATEQNCNKEWFCDSCIDRRTIKNPGRKIRRNEKCYCNSGEKFKNCHSPTMLEEQEFMLFLEKKRENPETTISLDDYVGGSTDWRRNQTVSNVT